MKKQNSIQFIVFLVLFFSSMAYSANMKRTLASIGIKSSEEIIFRDKKDILFSETGKIDQYQGVLIQLSQPKSQFAQSDLYLFENESEIKMTASMCDKYISKIFGSKEKRVLKISEKLQIFKSHTGDTCDMALSDPESHALINSQYVLFGFLHGRLVGLVWQLDQPLTPADKNKFRKFWDTLR